jgi:hypothetical protein
VKYLVQFATFPPPAEPGVKSGTWTRVGDTGADPTFVFLLAHRMINAPPRADGGIRGRRHGSGVGMISVRKKVRMQLLTGIDFRMNLAAWRIPQIRGDVVDPATSWLMVANVTRKLVAVRA